MYSSNNIIYPDFSQRNRERPVPPDSQAAQVIFDFQYIYEATLRRKKFHRFMNRVDSYAAEEPMPTKTREDIYRLLLTRITEHLTESRYHLDMDVINAVSKIVTIVVDCLGETKPEEFSATKVAEAIEKATNPGDAALLHYVFSEDRASSPELEGLKDVMREYYLEKAEATWKQYGRAGEDDEMMYEHMGHILPLIVGLIKLYMIPYRSKPHTSITDHTTNS